MIPQPGTYESIILLLGYFAAICGVLVIGALIASLFEGKD